MQRIPTLFFNATCDRHSKTIYLKVVNCAGASQKARIKLSGVEKIASTGTAVVMCATSPDDTNSISEPEKVIPITSRVDGLGMDFIREFPAYSITVLRLNAR